MLWIKLFQTFKKLLKFVVNFINTLVKKMIIFFNGYITSFLKSLMYVTLYTLNNKKKNCLYIYQPSWKVN